MRFESLKRVESYRIDASDLRQYMHQNLEEQRISSEGQLDSPSQQISNLSQIIDIFKKRWYGTAMEVDRLTAEVAKVARRTKEIVISQYGSAEIIITALQRVEKQMGQLWSRISPSTQPRPSSSQPHTSSTRPPLQYHS